MSQIVTADLDCLGCGYNLRTRPRDGQCPECGKDVAWSLPVFADGAVISAALAKVRTAMLTLAFGVPGALIVRFDAAWFVFAILLITLIARVEFARAVHALTRSSLPGTELANPLRLLVRTVKFAVLFTVIGGALAVFAGDKRTVFCGLVLSEFAGFVLLLRLLRFAGATAQVGHALDLASGFRGVHAVLVVSAMIVVAAWSMENLLLRSLTPDWFVIWVAAALVMPLASLIAIGRAAFLAHRLRRFLLRTADAPAATG